MANKNSFETQVSQWAAQTKERMVAVFRDAAQTVANEVRKPVAAGGRMPVSTGNLRRSLMASTSGVPAVRQGEDQEFGENDGQITMVIAGAQITDTITLAFQANYARHMEYGTKPHMIYPREKQALHFYVGGEGVFASSVKHPGTQAFAFVRTTAQNWPQIVEDSARRIQSRVETRQAFGG